MKAALFLTVLIIASAVCAEPVHHSFTLSWIDTNPGNGFPPADSFIVYRSLQPDTGYTFLASTADTFYVDAAVPNDTRVYYAISAVVGYVESERSNWSSGRSVDATADGQYVARLHQYYPGDEMILLVVFPPAESCFINTWQCCMPIPANGFYDIISIRCEPPVYTAPVARIE